MAQHDYVISNGTGAAVRSDLNNALLAIVSQNSGATEPTTTYAYQWWADTTTGLLKIRNSANNAWITLRELDGTLTIEDGTVSAPGLAFRDDLNTGIWRPGTDQFAISTNGVERVEWGTSEVVFNDGGTNYDFRVEGDTNANLLFVDASADAIGVGTSTPQAALTVGANSDFGAVVKISRTDSGFNSGVLALGDGNSGNTYIGMWRGAANSVATAGNWLNLGGYDGISLATGNATIGSQTRAITIDSSQRVGVGTTSVNDTLEVSGSAIFGKTGTANQIRFRRPSDSALTGFFGYTNSADDTQLEIRAEGGLANVRLNANNATGFLRFDTNNTERCRLDSSGRLLLGTSSSTGANNVSNSRLQVNGNNAGGSAYLALVRSVTAANTDELGRISFADGVGEFASITATADAATGSGDYPGRLVFSTTADGASSPTERMRIGQNGQTDCYTSGGDGFTVRSSNAAGTSLNLFAGLYSATSTQNGSYSVAIRTNGNILNTNGSYTSLSDAKLKENIIDAGSQWGDLKAIKIRNWNFREDTGYETHRQIGPIAQELEEVCPSLVFTTPDRNPQGDELGTSTKSINQSVLYMKAVKALQEAMERIEQLEAKVAALEGA